jgi:3D (Asp-Asp-Asp) domain-containing protein
MLSRLRKILAPLLLSVLLLITSCAKEPPSRFEQAQQQSSQQKSGQAVVKDATQGANFNKFFPSAGSGYERVYTQEKKGFAEAKLKKDGKDVAMLSISDTKSTPSAATKYQQSTKKIGGYPALEIGTTQTGVLVNNRYQVKVLSRDPSLTPRDREAWLQKFDLNGLSRLQ